MLQPKWEKSEKKKERPNYWTNIFL
jgi:hypothetical protein